MFSFAAERWMSSPLSKEKETFNFKFKFMKNYHFKGTKKLRPYPFLFAVTVAASMCFASPFSTPPNALVMPAGRYTFMDYVKVGLPLQIIMGVVMVFVLPLLFPF